MGTIEDLAKRHRLSVDFDAEPLILDPSDPLSSARRFVELVHMHRLGRTLYRHAGSFWTYTGTHYRELPAEELRAALYPFLAVAKRRVRSSKNGKIELAPFKPTTSKVSQVIDALAAHAFLAAGYAMPAWLDDRAALPPRELVPLANGLLHLPTGQLVAHTPQYFGGYALPFAYNPAAGEPAEWLRFLTSIWPDDNEARDTLQELMGLLLTPETRYQKLFLIVGPKRSGKGTVGRVIRAMLGGGNVPGPTLSSLATNFGLQPLIGKPAAIISDARLSGRADAAIIAERLLSISGEDAITVDRKHVDPWTGTLPTRFVILTNELPRIADASGALASRFVVLTMRESFFGREDHGLTDRLIAELPGILNWAAAGWKRLAERGHFVMPRSSADAVQDIESLSSPILAFLRSCCEVRPGAEVECSELFERWCGWCKSEGRDHPGTAPSFGRDLKAAVAGVEVQQPRRGELRVRVYAGVGIRAAEQYDGLARVGTRVPHCTPPFRTGSDDEEKKKSCNGVERVPTRVSPDAIDAEFDR
ncbi:MAG: phage/plasmid primase, P4 family [Geminicoccaceae bacterium]